MRKILFLLPIFVLFSSCTKKSGTEPGPQPEKKITVAHPVAGDFLIHDSSYTINWFKEGDIQNVDLFYRVCDDSPWIIIDTGIGGLSATWTVPRVRTAKAKVKISASDDSLVFDTNEGYFIIDSILHMDMVLMVCDSSFLMGSDSTEPGHCLDEEPVHSVSLSTFYISKKEVRNVEYRQFCDLNSYQYPYDPGFPGMADYFDSFPDYPVLMVSWYDAARYCNWLSSSEGFEPQYDTVTWECRFTGGYRLPTEAEWEYAARGGLAQQYYPWGDEQPQGMCNWSGDALYPYTSPVVSFEPNGYGLYNMAGNVWEWCDDFYGSDYYSSSPSHDPKGPGSGFYKVIRGGSWEDGEENIRCAKRGPSDPTFSDVLIKTNTLGFRIVLGI